MSNCLSILDKCRGAMVATAIGDALGWPNEDRSGNTSKKKTGQDKFVSWQRRTGGRFYHHIETIQAGEYSDDTQMVLSVARSIIAGNWEDFFKYKELPFWAEYERGGGKALLRAAKLYKTGKKDIWQSEQATDYFQAGGNGAAMRILPHVIANEHRNSRDELFINIVKDCLITHGHPRAVLGATCYAYALNWLLEKNTVLEYGELVSAVKSGRNEWGKFPENVLSAEWLEAANRLYDYRKIWDQTSGDMSVRLDHIYNSLQQGLMVEDTDVLAYLRCFEKEKGAGDVAVLAAIYLASKYANNLVLGIKVPALMPNTDSDTIASITGGLLGMLCGLEQIPLEWRSVQDYSCLIQITDILTSESRADESKNVTSKEKEKEIRWENSPIGAAHYLRSQTVQCGKKTCVDIETWKTALGQTLYIKRYHQNSNVERDSDRANKCVKEGSALTAAVKKYFSNLGYDYALLGENCVIPDKSAKSVVDLLYYNRTLSCLVAVELKVGNITDEAIDRMRACLSALDNIKKKNENPSMGIVVSFCRGNVQTEIVCSEKYYPILAADQASKLLDKHDFEKYLKDIH